jgi:glucan phosphoethanolaminetransferase (alkaline phosphatase superfamily)
MSATSERRHSWAAVARRLGIGLSVYALLPACFLAAYLLVYDAPRSAVLPHLGVLAGTLAALTGLRLWLCLAPVGERARRATAALLLVAIGLAMFVFYAAVLLGLQYWGRVTTVDLVGTYVPQADELMRALGHRPEWAAVGLVIVMALAWWAAYRYLKSHDWIAALEPVLSRPVAAALGALLLAIAVVSGAELPHRDWSARGEPLSLSLFPERGEVVLQSHAISQSRSARIDLDEDRVRAGYRPAAQAHRSNVIVIVADALRADHLALLGYGRPTTPVLEALAKAGAVRLATSAVSVCNESACGLRALASSRYLDAQATRPITLPELLRRHGYGVHYVMAGDHTNFYGLRTLYGAADSYFDGASQKARYVNDDRLVLDRLRSFGRWDGKPMMLQLHLMSSHALGKRLDDLPEFGPGENYDRLRWMGKPIARERAINFYDRGVLQTDHVVREILDVLQQGGYLEDALVVVTGDHGEALGERGRFSHGHSVWEEGLRVPFVLLAFGAADPGVLQAGGAVSQVDIAPTLLRALRIPIPSTWQGEPLQAAEHGRMVFFQQQQQIGLIDARTPGRLYKHWTDLRKGRQFTFDLLADRGETADVSSSVPLALRQEWQRLLLARSAALGTGHDSDLDPILAHETGR